MKLKKDETCVILDSDGKEVFNDNSYGIRPFNYLFHKKPELLDNATCYCYEIGGAAATFLILGHIKKVVATNITKRGYELLTKNNVEVEYENLIDYIYVKKDVICPMEEASIQNEDLNQIRVDVENIIKFIKEHKTENNVCGG